MTSAHGAGARGSALLVALFLGALGAPAFDHLLRPDSARSPEREMRPAAPMPPWSWTPRGLAGYPEAFAGHFNDGLGLRDKLLHGNTLLELELFGRFPSDALYAGRDGWWYYAENDSIPAWRGLRPFRESELESWRQALEEQRDWLRKRGIEFLFVIAPNKETIYPEHLPRGYARVGPTRMEQLFEYMRARSDVPLLDLRPALLAEKSADSADDLLYYPLGIHWTERGSWVAYREILRALRPRLPCLPEAKFEDFTIRRTAMQGDSWAERLYAPGDFLQSCYEIEPRGGFRARTLPADGRPGLIRRECSGASCESLLLLHDSFGYKTDCFLSEIFRHQMQYWQITLEEPLVDEAQPQVVVEIYAEFKLMNAPPHLVRTQDPQDNRALFERAGRGQLVFDPSTGVRAIEGRNGTRVEADPAGAAITTRFGAQTFLAPPIEFPRKGAAILQLVIDSPVVQELDVFYLREGDTSYERSRSFQIPLEAGTNTVYRRIEGLDLAGRLSVRPRVPGRLLLRRIELRGIPGT